MYAISSARRLVILSLVGVTVGCGSGSDLGANRATQTAPKVTVTAGVTQIEHPATALIEAQQFSVDSVPAVVITGSETDPRFDLTRVYTITQLSDGRFVAIQYYGHRVMIFNANGTPARAFGQSGRGPGDFMSIRGMVVGANDTLIIQDNANRKVSWALPDSGVIRMTPLIVEQASFGGLTDIAGALRGSRLVVYSNVVADGVRDSVIRPPVPVVVMDFDGGNARKIVDVPGLEMVMVKSFDGGQTEFISMPLRFSLRPSIVAWDSLIAVVSAATYQVDLYSEAGALVKRIRVPVPRRPVTQAIRESLIAMELDRLPSNISAAARVEGERQARQFPFADSLPPYGPLFVSPDHTLWVVDYLAPSDSGFTATAFRKDGTIAGRLRVPHKGWPAGFGNDQVMVKQTNDDGLVSFSVYRFRPSEKR